MRSTVFYVHAAVELELALRRMPSKDALRSDMTERCMLCKIIPSRIESTNYTDETFLKTRLADRNYATQLRCCVMII